MVLALYPVQVGWQDAISSFEIEIECPNTLKDCSSNDIVRHGHDTQFDGAPQHYECKKCHRHIYHHTMGLHHIVLFNPRFNQLIKVGQT